MPKDIVFMPLGGGQRVGASCYYLRLGDSNILLDAGIGKEKGLLFEPNIYSLLTSKFMESPNQIHQIYVSHAHFDHSGFLPELLRQARIANVYMTSVTSLLIEYQLYDKKYFSGNQLTYCEEERLAMKMLFEKISKVSYMQKMDFGQYKVTFLPAGHIPGAMMILFEYGKKKILYTGDYSIRGTELTKGCIVPEGLEVDIVIMCGLHAKHSNYKHKEDILYKSIQEVYRTIKQDKVSIQCPVIQLSKGIELIKLFQKYNEEKIPIYLDTSTMEVVQKMEQLSIPILDENTHIMLDKTPKEPHIYITSRRSSNAGKNYKKMKIDFSLHEDFYQMKEFLKRLNPKYAVIVHCDSPIDDTVETIEQLMMLDGESRTQFIFAEENELYQL